jgi:hypothetical protein
MAVREWVEEERALVSFVPCNRAAGAADDRLHPPRTQRTATTLSSFSLISIH